MADKIYPKAKEAFLNADIDLLVDDIRIILIDVADYTYSDAHDFLDDVAPAARVAVSAALGSKTTTNGAFDAADVTLSSVSGDACEAVIVYKHTGVEATSNLIAYRDNSAAFTVTPNGGNIVIQWNAAGIFTI